MKNFWSELNRPFLALAPMEDVTDTVFRQVVARAGRPEVFFTEFMNVSGFCHPEGRSAVARRLRFSPTERPIVAQIWGSRPADFSLTAAELVKMGFAGIDINMGCPDKSVVKSGGGSALIESPDLAAEIIQATKAGMTKAPMAGPSGTDLTRKMSYAGQPAEPPSDEDEPVGAGRNIHFSTSNLVKVPENPVIGATPLPISVKTRLGSRQVEEWRDWLKFLLEQDLAALTVHLRTRREMSKVPAHHELIPDIVRLRDQIAPGTALIINGDIKNRAEAEKIYQEYIIYDIKIDGFMIGRGVFANPFCFEKSHEKHNSVDLLGLLKYHLDLFDQQPAVKFEPLKKFFKIYINNFPGASDLRARLMATNSTAEARQILDDAPGVNQ